MKLASLLIVPFLFFNLLGCDFLPGSGYTDSVVPFVEDPEVAVGEVHLTESPSIARLGAYYCPMLYDSILVDQVCSAALGTPPLETELQFRFTLPLVVKNPNSFPIPAVEVLTAITVFPKTTSHELAALCVTFCENGDLSCQGGADACRSTEPEVNSVDDFVAAAANYMWLYIENEVAGTVPPELRIKTIPANGEATIHLTFSLSPEPLLELLEVAFTDEIDTLVAGQSEDVWITIPYAVEGGIWFVVENFGKFGINFGPIEGEWSI